MSKKGQGREQDITDCSESWRPELRNHLSYPSHARSEAAERSHCGICQGQGNAEGFRPVHHPVILGREAVPWLVPAVSAQGLYSIALNPLKVGMCEQEFCPSLWQVSVCLFTICSCPHALGVMILSALIGLN